MPTGTLPEEGKKLWEKVHSEAKSGSCKDSDDVEQCAARVAWTAVKNAGWSKDSDGNWNKKSSVTEFSLRIERASYDKASGERRWKAVASDTDEDLYKDNMTLALFSDFLSKIETQIPVPEEFRSDFWSGGTPYLSVSHYLDLDGSGVPGPVEAVYVDGRYLKARGMFNDTPLGRACFEAVCKDLYGEDKNRPDKIRISIAFLDYGHKHKSNGFIFDRKSLNDLCPECLRELITGENTGKEFLKGHLIHLALTRVPVNQRTSMEVERSMTTRKEDAASIIGEDLAEELEQLENKSAMVGKSETLIIKSKKEDDEEDKEDMDNESEEYDEEKKKKDKPKEKSDVVDDRLDRLYAMVEEIKSKVETPVIPEPTPHVLDTVFAQFKSTYDEIIKSTMSADEKLQAIQEPFNAVGKAIVDTVKVTDIMPKPEVDATSAIVKALTDALNPVAQKLELISNQLSAIPQRVQAEPVATVPQRRSIQPQPFVPQFQTNTAVSKSETPKLRSIIERTTR